MCGIVGSSPALLDPIEEALRRLSPRGPDSVGFVQGAAGMIGVRRLAITDLVHGDQPLSNPARNRHIVFNGAIYNLEYLRNTYSLNVTTGNDAEVVLALFELLGPDFTDVVEGMYAFLILDDIANTLWFGVDELGIKPLYFARDISGNLLLCSTLEALPRDWLMNAERLPPGTVWNLEGVAHVTRPIKYRHGWARALRSAVEAQVPREVPWGCLLSGGVDSSVLCRLATELGQVRTVSCGLAESVDVIQARLVAELLKTEHHEHVIDPDDVLGLTKATITVTGSFEPWLVLGGIGTLAACQAASDIGLKVLLSGEGADELFAGYRDFDDFPAAKLELALRDQQTQLGVTECLRLDRCSMAAGVEVRVPFLDRSVVGAVRELPVEEKRSHPGSPNSVSKVALRQYAVDLGLPDWVAFRSKVGFSTGTGVLPLVTELALSDKTSWASSADRRRFAAPGVDMDSPVAAWLLGLWLGLYGDRLASSWKSLEQRRLVRATVAD